MSDAKAECDDDKDECAAECINDASCDDLKNPMGTDPANPQPAGWVVCMSKC